MNAIVLDAGALIALERNDRSLWSALKLAALESRDVLVPSTVLAQVWRARAKQALLAKALGQCVIASFDDVAWEVGELCGRTGVDDVCDAHVALTAATLGEIVYTSDPGDVRRLIAACGKRRPTLIRC